LNFDQQYRSSGHLPMPQLVLQLPQHPCVGFRLVEHIPKLLNAVLHEWT